MIDLGLTIRRGTEDIMVKSYEKWKSLSVFLKLGADPNVRNREGKTPLQVLLEGLPEAYISKGRVIVFQPNRNQELLVLLLILLKLGEDRSSSPSTDFDPRGTCSWLFKINSFKFMYTTCSILNI